MITRDFLGSLAESIKSKVMALGRKKKKRSNSLASAKKNPRPYARMEKSGSVKLEMQSRLARRLIGRTLQAADQPGKISLPA